MKDLKLTVLKTDEFTPVKIEFTVTTIEELVSLWHRMNLNDFEGGYGKGSRYDIQDKYKGNSGTWELFDAIDDHIDFLDLKELIYKDGDELLLQNRTV